MPERFPAIEPYDAGMLDVGDGQHIYCEVSGNPAGELAAALHGGPGGCFRTVRAAGFGEVLRGVSFTPGTRS